MRAETSKNKKKYHFLYKTTCKITGKYYIGVHSTFNLNDGYLGSGKLLTKSLKQYGKENHALEILKFFENKEDKFQAEKEYITSEMIDDSNCLNFSYGGYGGIQNDTHLKRFIESGKKAFQEKLKDPEYKKRFSQNSGFYKLHKDNKAPSWNKTYSWEGKKHKIQTIEKMKASKKDHGVGGSNSQFGTMWITNGIENKKIKNNQAIPVTWYKGRTLK